MMPNVLLWSDPLPQRPRRVLIAGTTGVGKSALGRSLGKQWRMPYTEMDALHHGPNWTTRPTFAADVEALAAQEEWITEWQYWGHGMKHVVGDRADTLIWLDFPRPLALQRLLRRTIRRSITKEPMWAGNTEPPLWKVFTQEDHILRWEMKTHSKWRERMPQIALDFPQMSIVQLRTPSQVRRWLAGPADLGPAA